MICLRLLKKNTLIRLQLVAAGAISWLLLVQHLAPTVAAGRRVERRASWWLMRCWTQPLVCIRSTWVDQSQTRPDKGVSLAFPPRSAPFKNIQNPGTQTPTLHKVKARQNVSRGCPFCLHKETIVCLYTPSLPGLCEFILHKGTRQTESNLAEMQRAQCLSLGNVRDTKAATGGFHFFPLYTLLSALSC